MRLGSTNQEAVSWHAEIYSFSISLWCPSVIGEKLINLETDTIKAAFIDNVITPLQDTADPTWDGTSLQNFDANGVSTAGGYSAAGFTMSGPSRPLTMTTQTCLLRRTALGLPMRIRLSSTAIRRRSITLLTLSIWAVRYQSKPARSISTGMPLVSRPWPYRNPFGFGCTQCLRTLDQTPT